MAKQDVKISLPTETDSFHIIKLTLIKTIPKTEIEIEHYIKRTAVSGQYILTNGQRKNGHPLGGEFQVKGSSFKLIPVNVAIVLQKDKYGHTYFELDGPDNMLYVITFYTILSMDGVQFMVRYKSKT